MVDPSASIDLRLLSRSALAHHVSQSHVGFFASSSSHETILQSWRRRLHRGEIVLSLHSNIDSPSSSQIATIDDSWQWLENSFVFTLRAQPWYNDAQPLHLTGFLNDKSNRMIGWATMRQVRASAVKCSVSRIQTVCASDASWLSEEQRSFTPGWLNESTSPLTNTAINRAFQYQSSDALDTFVTIGNHGTYPGGGYVYDFRGRLSELQGNLSRLHQLQWIDNRTRAVIIQMSLYNPSSNLYT